MPTPREIAKKVNDSSMFSDAEAGYDATEGCPTAVAGHAAERSYITNPVNPPEPPAPCTNLKK